VYNITLLRCVRSLCGRREYNHVALGAQTKSKLPWAKFVHPMVIFSRPTWMITHKLGPLHTQAKSRDLIMVRTLDSHPKAVPWVLGKLFLCSHMPSSIVWIENGPCSRPLHTLLAEKEEGIWFNIICLKLYQFKRTTWWCLYVPKYVLNFTLQSVILEKLLKKSWSHGICKFR